MHLQKILTWSGRGESTGHENKISNATSDVSTEMKIESQSNSNLNSAVGVYSGQLNRSEPRKRPHCHIQGLITHPFKLVTGVPSITNLHSLDRDNLPPICLWDSGLHLLHPTHQEESRLSPALKEGVAKYPCPVRPGSSTTQVPILRPLTVAGVLPAG